MASVMEGVTPELIEEMNRPGPRYTSYPTAPQFKESFGPAEYADALARFGREPAERPLSVYVHLPFCGTLCLFCACNTVITKKPGVASRYLDAFEAEVATVARAIGRRPRVTQLHLGGGTPTYLTVPELRRLHAILAARFEMAPGAEMAVEVDPRVTTPAQMEALASLGWNRASFGVQDFAADVQRAVNRVQSVEETRALVEAARRLGFSGINVDLIYGLPFQKEETFRATLDATLAMRPDRIALYSYAHVPWLRKGQQGFERHELPLPSPAEKIALMRMAILAFERAGYVHLGLDHFALPEDELARGLAAGTLHRNFQGYTVRRADDLVGLGQSAIGDLMGAYAQNEKENALYESRVLGGSLATVRGVRLTEDDERRRRAILAVMCEGALPPRLQEGLAAEVASLAPLEARGLVRRDADGTVRVTALGRLFLRNIAMCFDAYLAAAPAGRPMYSKTV
jgi:oxygen-independent coproporphyrinogen-3 oxidase